MNSYIIPNELARQLAVALYPGIAEYVQAHQEEYMQFLKETAERKENKQNDMAAMGSQEGNGGSTNETVL